MIDAARDKGARRLRRSISIAATPIGKNHLDNAIKDLSASIDAHGRSAVVYFSRATAYKAKGDLDNAIADLDQTIKLDPRQEEIF